MHRDPFFGCAASCFFLNVGVADMLGATNMLGDTNMISITNIIRATNVISTTNMPKCQMSTRLMPEMF